MALTLHWEWRAFGVVSEVFSSTYNSLPNAYADDRPQRIVDEYLWKPGIELNIKFRKGTGDQDGLKLKRFWEAAGPFEKWSESPDEVFPLPLSVEARRHIPADAARVRVVKERRAKLWGGEAVKVEVAKILEPAEVVSVGLEILGKREDQHSIHLLHSAVQELKLQQENLVVMNYLRWLDHQTPLLK